MNLFKKELEGKELAPGIEMINVQSSDPIIKILEKNVASIKDSVLANISRIEISEYVLNIEEAIENRFGFKCRIKTNGPNMSCGIFGFDNDGGLLACSDIVKAVNAKKNPSEFLDQARDKIIKLDIWAKSNGIKVDEKSAYISNLPSDFKVDFYFNFRNIFLNKAWNKMGNIDLTPLEVVSMMMHEIGHAYSFIAYSYRTRCSRIVFEDVLRDQIKKGSEPKKAMLVAYKEAYDRNVNEKEFKNLSAVSTVFICAKGIFDRYAFNGRGSKSDPEFLADQFVARFGLANEITSALKKIQVLPTSYLTLEISEWSLREVILIVNSIKYLIASLGVFTILLSQGLVTWFVLSSLLIIGVYIFTDYLLGQFFKKVTGSNYDTDLRRIERIKNELVRQIRLDMIDKKLIQQQLEYIENLEELVKIYESMRKSRLLLEPNKIIEFFSSDYTNARQLEEFDQKVEDLMENQLYVEANKF